LLQTFGNQLEKFQLQKLLLLFSEMQKEADYNFVPYKYGCFSFQANADLSTLSKYGLVSATEQYWKKETPENFVISLRKQDADTLKALKHLYEHKSSDELIAITYRKFPYYAIKSKIADKILNETELSVVKSRIPVSDKKCLFTIGYEGISLEEYLNKLIKLDIKVLCDVRKNSFSMKYGFSKSQLKGACEGLGILFFHFPDVGIESENRQNLETKADRDALFQLYRAEVLPRTKNTQQAIFELLQEHGRVAITCFEAQSCDCHRSHLADAIRQMPQFNFEVKHL
jgi:uncharacterized protein (DUF488 family)